MAVFLYVSDVFCPWCYGFGPVLERLHAEYPHWGLRVLGGNLVDEPVTLAEMLEESPHLRDFFIRLEKTTAGLWTDFCAFWSKSPICGCIRRKFPWRWLR